MPFLPSTTDRVDRGFAAGRSPGACAYEMVIIAIATAAMPDARAAPIMSSDSRDRSPHCRDGFTSPFRTGTSIGRAVRMREDLANGVRNRPVDRCPAHFYTEDTIMTRARLVNLCPVPCV
jgi:hypothetical protein